MIRCPACASFVPLRADAAPSCPECGVVPSLGSTNAERPTAKRANGLVTRARQAALGVSTAMTLMACYGVAYEPVGCSDPTDDRDGDGYCGELDCDETSASIHRYASDPAGDGVDSNCDGVDGTDADTSDDAGTSEDGG